MLKPQTTDPCYELEDKEDKQTEEITKTHNQLIMTKIIITITMTTIDQTKTITTTQATNKEMINKDQIYNTQTDQTDKTDHITKKIDAQINETIKKGND